MGRRANRQPMKGSQSVQRGWKAYEQGDWTQAEAEFRRATGENPDGAFAHLQQGLFELRRERPEAAANGFELALSKEPQNPAPQFFLALARELQGEVGLADAALEQLANSCPRHQGLTSLRLLKELRRGTPGPVLAELGFGQKGRAGGENWQTLMAGLGIGDPKWLPPDLSSSQYLLGPILVEVEKRLLPLESPLLEHRTGDIATELDALEPPKRQLAQEIRNIPRSCKGGGPLRKGQRALAKAWSTEDSAEQKALAREAVRQLRLGNSMDSFAFRTNYYLGEAYLLLAKEGTGSPYSRAPLHQAERRFMKSVQLDGNNPYVMLYLALVQQNLGRPEAALVCYHKATEKFTKLPEAHYGMGQCHLLMGRPGEAREFLLKAVNSDLVLARDRLNLLASQLEKLGPDALSQPLPAPPAPALPVPPTSSDEMLVETEAAPGVAPPEEPPVSEPS